MSQSATMEERKTRAAGGKYLTFALGKEEFGIQILKVREIIGMMEITGVPRSPASVRGVINLRGQVISVVDLRTRFGLETIEKTDQTCVIVVETSQDDHRISVGVIVDHVSEVLEIAPDCIEDPPSFGASVETDFIIGIGKIGQTVKILLDVDKVIAGNFVGGM